MGIIEGISSILAFKDHQKDDHPSALHDTIHIVISDKPISSALA